MRGRPKINAAAPTRSSLADAAFAVEERLVWGGADLLRAAADAIRWPFERLVWAVERGLVWRLEERTDSWSGSVRAAGASALVLLAVAAGVLGLVLVSNGGSAAGVREASAPVVEQAPPAAPAEPTPVLHGITPNFSEGAGVAKHADGSVGTAAPAGAGKASARGGTGAGDVISSRPADAKPPTVALETVHQFAESFVLYEIGKGGAKVASTFTATASPRLAHTLLRHPPRLPAHTKVPQAKVLNVVPGPPRGSTYTFSVSLLRLGITSELRLFAERETDGKWRVTDVRG
jgi:hypothetical protein